MRAVPRKQVQMSKRVEGMNMTCAYTYGGLPKLRVPF